jgi:1-acyl-sn-glycerol-3-phosphate acyltransferase
MSITPITLLNKKRFLPYFITQFFGAFNDNIFKNTLLLFVAFASADTLAISSNLFINLAAGLFILPFFLFSASAGVMADQCEKSAFIRKVKLLEIVIMVLGALAFITESYTALLVLLFLMGSQSAFFGPVKYALLPQQLKETELVTGNALVETGTFLAILLGTLVAGIIASVEHAKYIAAACVVLFAILGYLSSRYIPVAEATSAKTVFRWQPIQQTKQTLAIAKNDSTLYTAILTISWFWFLGATYLTQFPNFAKTYLAGSENSVSLLLALFSVGIAIGSLACDRLSQHRIELGIVPLSSFGISLFGYLLAHAVPESLPSFEHFSDFVLYAPLWPLFGYLLLIGICGGLFIVPLYTLLQKQAQVSQRAQVFAALNIYNALFMVVSAVLGIVTLSILHLSIVELFSALSLINLLVALYLLWKKPIHTLRFSLSIAAKIFYRPTYKNIGHIPDQGGALMICNHVSYIDALLISAASPRLIRFVMEADYANFPIARYILRRAGVIPISANRASTIRQAFNEVENALTAGELVCIFPEGKLTDNGEMGPFLRGSSMILQRVPVPVIPIAIKGLWGSYFSRYRGRACKGLPSKLRPQIELEIGEAVAPSKAMAEVLHAKVISLRGEWR